MAWILNKPSASTKKEVKKAIEQVFGEVQSDEIRQDRLKALVKQVIETLQDEIDRWKWFNETFWNFPNPLYYHIYHTVRNKLNKLTNSVVVGTVAACSEQEIDDDKDHNDVIDKACAVKNDTPIIIETATVTEMSGKQNTIAAGKSLTEAVESVSSSETISDVEFETVSQDPDDLKLYSQMSYWPGLIASRRRIKKYMKKVRRERKLQHTILDNMSKIVLGQDDYTENFYEE